MLALGVQRVRGDHHAGQVDAGQGVEQRGEPVDLAGLAVHATCPSTTRVCWSITASRCRPGTSTPSGSVCREPRRVLPSTASTRRRPAGASAGAQPLDEPADRGVEPVGVDLPAAPGGSSTPTGTAAGPERGRDLVGQVGDPLGDRDERPRPGRDRAHRRGRAPRPGRGGPRGACADRPPRASTSAGPGRAQPDRVAPPRPPGRRQQRSTRMQTRARLSSDDQAWCENRKITTRAVPAPAPQPACRRSSAPTHRDFADPLGFAVIGATRQLGLLCVDAWRPNALSGPEDESLIEAFATLLAAGLVLRAGITTSLAAATRSATKTSRGTARSWPGPPRRSNRSPARFAIRRDEMIAVAAAAHGVLGFPRHARAQFLLRGFQRLAHDT